MRQLFWVIGAAVLMTGCGSAVKLDSVPVEDKSGVAVSQQAQDGESNAIAKSGVSAVDMGKSSPHSLKSFILSTTALLSSLSFKPLLKRTLALSSKTKRVKLR
jgi:uncharacterized protein YceK